MTKAAEYFKNVADVLPHIPVQAVEQLIEALKKARAERRQIFVFGNGGSAAAAAHFVVDLVKCTSQAGKPRFRATCLSDNIPTLTAYANDAGYEMIFAEPLTALAEPGDVALGVSTSGNSPNVLRAMAVAREKCLVRLGLTGCSGGKLKDLCDSCVLVPSANMQIIEDAHLVVLHGIFVALHE